MKSNIQYECLDEHCRTVLIAGGKRLDGWRCPRCEGPVVPRPFAPKTKQYDEEVMNVRKVIIHNNLKHCFAVTPDQVETIIKIIKGEIKSE